MVFFQETHANHKNVLSWEQEWGRKWVSAFGSLASGGVSIAVRPGAKIVLQDIYKDIGGGEIHCCKYECRKYLLHYCQHVRAKHR